MSKRPLRLAVIGLGIGRHHLKTYANYERSEAIAICDANAKRLAAVADEYGLPEDRCYTDYKKLLADAAKLELDGVSVALPNALHAPVAKAAFAAGLHVLCEKPLAMNAREGRAMLAAAEKARKTLMVNFSFRFHPQSRSLKALVDEGAIGDIYYGRTIWHRRRGLPGFGGWFGQKKLAGGGPVIDLGVHRMDLAMWLMGNPRPVTVSGSTYSVIGAKLAKSQKKAFDVEDLGCAMIRFDSGATLLLEASWAGFSEKKEDMITQLYGTEGGILQRNVGQGYDFEARVYCEQGGALWESTLQQSLDPTPVSYQEFVDAIYEGREPIAPGRHALDVQLILDAIYRSAGSGKEVRIPKK